MVHGVVAIARLNFVGIDLEALHAVLQLGVLIGHPGHPNYLIIKVFQVLFEPLWGVPVRVTGHKHALQVHVMVLRHFADQFECPAQLN